jgi:hypothetical protein
MPSNIYKNMNSSELLVIFRDQLLLFTDELLEIFQNEPKLILIRVYIENNLVVEDVVRKFAKALNGPDELEQMITNRNEDFFLNYDMMKLNNNTDTDSANFMLELWKDDRLENDDKTTIWSWVDLFVNIAQSYVSKN